MGRFSTFIIKRFEMNQPKLVFSFAWIAALLAAAPAMGQLLNHPVQALPLGDAAGSTFVGAEFARGLNDDSEEQSSFAMGVGRAMNRVSFMGMGGYVASDTDEVTLGANVAVHLLSDAGAVQVSIQGGVGWASLNFGTESQTEINLPIGITIQGTSNESVTPWVMPRLHIVRTGESGVLPSDTSTDFGAAAGLSVNSESGSGFHVAIDYVNLAGGSPFGFAIGGHYIVSS